MFDFQFENETDHNLRIKTLNRTYSIQIINKI